MKELAREKAQTGNYLTNGQELDEALSAMIGKRKMAKYAGQSWEALLYTELAPVETVFIVNMDKLGGPGTHWTAMVCDNGWQNAYYYDSLGKRPPAGLTKLIRGISPDIEIYYFDSQTQPDASQKCGFYALEFLRRYLAGQRLPELYDWEYKDGDKSVMEANEKTVV